MYVTNSPSGSVDVLRIVNTAGVERKTLPLLVSVTDTAIGLVNVDSGWSVMVLVLVDFESGALVSSTTNNENESMISFTI